MNKLALAFWSFLIHTLIVTLFFVAVFGPPGISWKTALSVSLLLIGVVGVAAFKQRPPTQIAVFEFGAAASIVPLSLWLIVFDFFVRNEAKLPSLTFGDFVRYLPVAYSRPQLLAVMAGSLLAVLATSCIGIWIGLHAPRRLTA